MPTSNQTFNGNVYQALFDFVAATTTDQVVSRDLQDGDTALATSAVVAQDLLAGGMVTINFALVHNGVPVVDLLPVPGVAASYSA